MTKRERMIVAVAASALVVAAWVAIGRDAAGEVATCAECDPRFVNEAQANSISTAMIQNNAVTSTKILNGTVSNADLANNAVTTGKIVDGQVTTADIAAGAVTQNQINLASCGLGNICVEINGLKAAVAALQAQVAQLQDELAEVRRDTSVRVGWKDLSGTIPQRFPLDSDRETPIPFNCELADSEDVHAFGDTGFVVQTPGVYLISGSASFTEATSGQCFLFFRLERGGVERIIASQAVPAPTPPAAPNQVPVALSTFYDLEPGDFVSMTASQTGGAGNAMTIEGSYPSHQYSPAFGMVRVSPEAPWSECDP